MKSVYRNVLALLSLGIILSFLPGNLSRTSLAQDPCQKIIDAIANLEEMVLGLEDELRDASGLQITVLRNRIKALKQRIKTEEEVLDRCIKNHTPVIVPGSEDEIRLRNQTGSDKASVLIDGRRDTGCSNDEIFRGRLTVSVGNILSNQGCIPEVAVFSQSNAMQLVSPLNVWTNQNTDTLDVRMADPVRVPLIVWVLQGPFTTVQDQVNADVARANQLFDTMQAGVQFVVKINNATADPDAESLLNAGCLSIDSLMTKIGFAPNQINVYYLETALLERGGFCPGTSIVRIGATLSDNESLAHEIGHAFSLGHTSDRTHTADIPGIPQTNLMASGGLNRDSITTGQCFRINMNSTSVLNSNGNRTGPTRDCPDDVTSNQCPSLALDVQPK